MASRRTEIEAGLLRVLLIDECHLLWGDLSGYVWGSTDQEIAVPVVNERDKQTYYGAVDYLKGELLLKAYNAGNSENTIDYLRYLLAQSPNQQLLIFWDGASYHRSHLVQDFLAEVNLGLPSENWLIHCVRFAPNCPSQNPPHGYLVTSKNLGAFAQRLEETFLCFASHILTFKVDV